MEKKSGNPEIVLYEGRPALVIARSANGRSLSLKLSRGHYKAVMIEHTTPYEGDQDAFALGLLDQ